MKHQLLPLLLSLSSLTGCMTYSESFDCPPGVGVGCKSLSQVNDMVEQGDLPQSTKTKEPKKSDSWIEAHKDPLNLLPQENPSEDSYLKIWIAGYQDGKGHYHAPSYVYASFREGYQLDAVSTETRSQQNLRDPS